MSRIIGIDLGTTYTCAAVVIDGKPVVIPCKSANTVPSMIAVDNKGNELIGHEAKRQSVINPLNTIHGTKRLIGRKYDSRTTQVIRRHFKYELEEDNSGNVQITMAGSKFSLSDVAARILNRMRNYAQEFLNERVEKAVVTVPAYFNDRQRQSVKSAGEQIDLEIVRIINEPTAAAIGYGFGRDLNEKVLIYDMGGGTFDVSVCAVRGPVFEVMATGGNTFLGGVDFDDRIISYVLKKFKDETGKDLSNDAIAVQRIRDGAEKARIDLSSVEEYPLSIPYVTTDEAGNALNIDLKLTRAILEGLTKDLVDKSFRIVEQVLEDSKLTKDQVGHILLVGGMTRMPLVQQRVHDYFGRAPAKAVNPDEAVAIGAAILAHSSEPGSTIKVQLLDVVPISIGIALPNGQFLKIFEKNTSIPNAKSKIFTTSKDNQSQIQIQIRQGESQNALNNEILGNFCFQGIRAAPKGEPKIEAIFHLSEEGILKVTAKDRDTGQEQETTLDLRGN
ncbi:MAG: Hsp70 family protein [Chrysiogenetes bacterium]|nr:Hsp70 family protein [Chrysiogenetes bacterium]